MLALFRTSEAQSRSLGFARDDNFSSELRNIHLRSTKFLGNDVTNPNSFCARKIQTRFR